VKLITLTNNNFYWKENLKLKISWITKVAAHHNSFGAILIAHNHISQTADKANRLIRDP
jgi:hypothetical protein